MPYAHTIENQALGKTRCIRLAAKIFWTGCTAGTHKIIIGSVIQTGANYMKSLVAWSLVLSACCIAFTVPTQPVNAAGWSSVHKYVKPSGKCAGHELLASSYSSGRRTSSGERFDPNGNTAAARSWPIGTTLTVTNPHNGRSVTVRINDRGPWGIAYRMGARLDLARGAAQRIGMHGSQYVCIA